MADAAPDRSADAAAVVVGLAHALRGAGVRAAPDRVHATVQALTHLDAGAYGDVYWAGRLTLCATPEDVERFDLVFPAYWGDRPGPVVRRPVVQRPVLRLVPGGAGAPDGDDAGDDDETAGPAAAVASPVEVLRHRDIADLTGAERDELARVLAVFRLPGEVRRTRRLAPARRGRVDPQRTLRSVLAAGGEVVDLKRRAGRDRPRRVVLLVDVSGSMAAYADALLRFAHAATRRRGVPTEVFTVGTRLTRVTREIGVRDADAAMAAVASAVPDWSGGTRLGDLLKEFLDRWGQRGTARGAVVVVLSDGWERGDAALLGEQVARLGRLAHRVVWANPLKARPGYAPLAAGMAAALPHVDDFVEGHSLDALERLAAVVAGARRA